MPTHSRQLSGAAFITAVTLAVLPVFAFADPQASSDAQPAPAAKAAPPAQVAEAQGQQMETVHVDPRMPVIPLAAVRPLETDKMTLQEAKEALQSMAAAQQKMMEQMQTLQARIEKTEEVSQTNQQQIQATNDQLATNGDLLRTVSNRVRFDGYVEMGWRLWNNAPNTEEFLDAAPHSQSNTFEMRRVVLRPRINFTDKASWYGEVEFEDLGLDEITVEESVFNYAAKPWLNLKAGLFTLPYTHTAVNHDGPLRLLVDRPLVDNYVIPTTYSDLGVGVSGAVPVGTRSALTYEFDVVNGLQDTILEEVPDDLDGHRVSTLPEFAGLHYMRGSEALDNNRARDNNSNKAVFGRIGYSPFPGLQVDVAASTGKLDPQNRMALNVLSGDIQYRYKRFSFLGEYANAVFGHPKGTSSQGIPFRLFPGSTSGFYAQTAYDINPKWTAVAAYNWVDLDSSAKGNELQRLSLGMRYNPFRNVFLKTEYQLTSPRRFGGEHYSNAILTQLTFALL